MQNTIAIEKEEVNKSTETTPLLLEYLNDGIKNKNKHFTSFNTYSTMPADKIYRPQCIIACRQVKLNTFITTKYG